MRFLRLPLLGIALAASPACAARAPAATSAQAADDADRRMDLGLERLDAGDYARAAATFSSVYAALPESDLRRDLAAYDLAKSLVALGFVQAGVEYYFGIVSGRRVPDLVSKSLADLKPLYDARLVDRERLTESVLYGNQYGELAPDVTDFVEYLQALTDIRHGFADWGRSRMDVLAKTKRPYSLFARYALAVDRVARHEDDAAADELLAVAHAEGDASSDLRDEARLALGRIYYEKKRYEDAWHVYSEMGSTLPFEDAIILEKAWDLVGAGSPQRALGLLVGLGAPAFRGLFAPERDLIRALALRRLCQYRAAHVAVREFRATYGDVLAAIRGGGRLADDPTMRTWANAVDTVLADRDRIRQALAAEKAAVGRVADKPLREHLKALYDGGLTRVQMAIDRRLGHATERVADELLRVEEQMNLIDYEVGVGLFKSGDAKEAAVSIRQEDVPLGSQAVYFRFDGEYWSDEIGDYTVLAEDRCVR